MSTPPPEEAITAILTCYRRPGNLAEQVAALRSQTRPPEQIWLWVNHHEDNEGLDFSGLGLDRTFRTDFNWKFYGRFAVALLADTELVAIYDDDTIPGARWHENCLTTLAERDAILGTMGVVLHGGRFRGMGPATRDFVGWRTGNPEPVEVDFVGQAWLFRRAWLSWLWKEKPVTWENGEDIHFSSMAKIHGGIPTVCPPHPPDRTDLHGSTRGFELGMDAKATHLAGGAFGRQRDLVVTSALFRGWKTVNGATLRA